MTSLRGTRHPCVRLETRAALQPTGDRTAPNGAPYDHRFIASTELMASDRGIILADAWRVDQWMKRPRWIANHDLGGLAPLTQAALGRGVWAGVESGLPGNRVGPSGKALVAYVRYASTPFAQEVRTLYDEGGLDDVSVRWDWQTEKLREPTDRERQAWGEELTWVAERTDLVEVSAVLLGADPGSQLMRRDVEAALERCRGAGRKLPHIERLLTNHGRVSVTTTARDEPDVMSAVPVLRDLDRALGALRAWLDAAGAIRHDVMDSVTLLQNLVAASMPDEKATTQDMLLSKLGGAAVTLDLNLSTEPEPPAASEEIQQFGRALTKFDVAYATLGTAVTEAIEASQDIAAALGVGDVVADDRQLVIDVDAVLRDLDVDAVLRDRTDESADRVGRPGVSEFAIDLEAILHDTR
jgi:hypothetical protein